MFQLFVKYLTPFVYFLIPTKVGAGHMTCFVLANGMLGVCDASKGMNQVCGARHAFLCLFHCYVKSFISNKCYAFTLGLRIYPYSEILHLKHSKKVSPAHNFKQRHSTKPGRNQLICGGPIDYEHKNKCPLL